MVGPHDAPQEPSEDEMEIADVRIEIPPDTAEWVGQQVEAAGGLIVVTTENEPER